LGKAGSEGRGNVRRQSSEDNQPTVSKDGASRREAKEDAEEQKAVKRRIPKPNPRFTGPDWV
jgi:hypothetical protein